MIKVIILTCLLIFSIASEGLIFFALFYEGDIWSISLLHILSTTILAFVITMRFKYLAKQSKLKPVLMLFLMIWFFFPVLGMCFSLIGYTVYVVLRPKLRSGLFSEYEKYIVEKSEQDMLLKSANRLFGQLREEVGFESLTDIMYGSVSELKIKAIDKMSRKSNKESIQLLQQATHDEHPEVRLHASTALLKIEAKYSRELHESIERSNRTRHHLDFLELGDFYYKYAMSGLVEDVLQKFYIQKAADAYQESLDIKTNEPDVVNSLVRCLMQLGLTNKAKKLLEKCCGMWPDNERLLFRKYEVYFIERDFKKIQEEIASLNRSLKPSLKNEVIDYWTN